MINKIPGTEAIRVKEIFEKRYRSLLGKDYEKFMEYSLSFLRRSIRINTLKRDVENVKKNIISKGWKLKQIPWCNQGFWIESERRDVGNLQEHALGYIYVQEAASMIPPVVLDPKPGEIVLDMCSSPGSKTSQIAMYMKNKGILIANDYKGMRVRPLGLNLQRIGATNIVITLMEGQKIKGQEFDRILVDAPCSGSGTIRKSLKTLKIWNENSIKKLAKTQLQLLNNAYKLLKPGGVIVYSTCSLEPEENEGVISAFLNEHEDMKTLPIDLDIKKGKPVIEFDGVKFNQQVKNVLRIWPQDNDTEGFFVAKLKKV